jgi:hypothetical protein
MKKYILFILTILLTGLVSCKSDEQETKITSIALTQEKLSLVVGAREKLIPIISSTDLSIEQAVWTSENDTIASVDSNGIVEGISVGQTRICLRLNEMTVFCNVEVVSSPITKLSMPDPAIPIAKNALIVIQGCGFNKNAKIWLKSISASGAANKVAYNNKLKSISTSDEETLATINEQAANYISFYANVNAGQYSVIYENEDKKYNLGNIEVEEVNLPEYEYDKSKIFWDDTHLRWFKLRGNVKSVTVFIHSSYWGSESNSSETNYDFGTDTSTYYFNKKGLLEKLVIQGYATIENEYDEQNRLKKSKEVSENYGSTRTYEFYYNSSDYYFPFPFFRCPELGPETYTLGLIDIWLKGYNKCIQTFESKNKVTTDTIQRLTYKDNLIVEDGGSLYPSKTYYSNKFPYKREYYMNNEYKKGFCTELYEFTETGLLQKEINYQNKINGVIDMNNPTIIWTWVKDSPFWLESTWSCSTENTFDVKYYYDSNLNQKQISWENDGISYYLTDNYYMSYDKQGNWTQCKSLYHSTTHNSVSTTSFIRTFSYW